jgi:hypothetical protein
MNRRQTTMMAVVSMALLATIITISSPTPALAHGHWNPDGDFTLQPQSDSDEMQIRPLSADKLLSAESASNPEEGQQPVASETIQMISISEEICDDGIDNDGDTLVDFTDVQCSAMEPQQQQQQSLQQEPVVVSGAEICDDDLDNDFDGKVDSRDEECSYITSSTSAFPTPGQAEPVTEEETGREDEEDKQQSDQDLNEESGGNENSDGEGDKEDNDSNDDEQEEDEEDEQKSDDEGNDDDEDDDDEQDDS